MKIGNLPIARRKVYTISLYCYRYLELKDEINEPLGEIICIGINLIDINRCPEDGQIQQMQTI